MKLMCIETVNMISDIEEERYQAFTKGKEYKARKGTLKGYNGNPYAIVDVLRAKNDKGESHIIKRLNSDDLNEFFNRHFEVIR